MRDVRPRPSIWLCFLAFVVTSIGATPMAASIEAVFPGGEWSAKEPRAVGLDKAKLDELPTLVRGRGCVVRHGYMVYTWGDHTKRGDVASAVKPWYSHFLFKALEDGRIAGVDEPVLNVEPRLAQINAALDRKDRHITWRHHAYQTSCYGLADTPGSAFDYNDWQMALFFDNLFLKVYGATWENVDDTVLRPMLTSVIGCQDNPTFMAFGTGDRAGRQAVSPRDFCRFGLLYLNKGVWNGKRVISEKYATAAVTQPLPATLPRASMEAAEMIPEQRSIGSRRIPDNQCDHRGSYSWLWWINGMDREGKRMWPDAPTDTYGCFGHGGKRAMVVLPSLHLIVCWNDTTIEGSEKENAALQVLVESVVDGEGR